MSLIVRIWLVFCFVFLVLPVVLKPNCAFAKILIISDIDDTLKISHVNSFWDKIDLAFLPESRFRGMSDLFQALQKENSEAKFFYLSNAPDWLMQFWYEEFLWQGRFPSGTLQLRDGESAEVHKLAQLELWILNEQPEVVILFGDNGERDPEFYHQIAVDLKNKHIHFVQYIRLVYDQKQGQDLS